MVRASWLLVLALGGCVSEEEYNAALKERDAARASIQTVQDELDQARGKIKELEKQLEESREKKPNRPPEPQLAAAFAQLKLSKGDKIKALMATSLGEIDCELFPYIAPTAVLNFVSLAEGTKEWIEPTSGEKTIQPLYDGTKFHRVVKGFLIQGGDPLGNGKGGPGYKFPDEVWPDVRFDRPGVLAMASSGPNSNGSQFFITDGRQPQLNMRSTIFGVCEMETVRKIMEVEVGGETGDVPVEDVILQKVTITRVKGSEAE